MRTPSRTPSRTSNQEGGKRERSTRRRSFTIVEALTGIVLMALLLAVIYIFLSGHILQRRHLEGYLELQRDTRLAILRLQRDLKALTSIDSAKRDANEELIRLELSLPAEEEEGDPTPLSYSFDAKRRAILRNGEVLIEDTIKNMQFWLLDGHGRDIFDDQDFERVRALRFRVSVSTPRNLGRREKDGESGLEEELIARGRMLDFTIYPRIIVSRHKARQGKLNLDTGRFAVRYDGGRASARPVED